MTLANCDIHYEFSDTQFGLLQKAHHVYNSNAVNVSRVTSFVSSRLCECLCFYVTTAWVLVCFQPLGLDTDPAMMKRVTNAFTPHLICPHPPPPPTPLLRHLPPRPPPTCLGYRTPKPRFPTPLLQRMSCKPILFGIYLLTPSPTSLGLGIKLNRMSPDCVSPFGLEVRRW